MRPSAMFPSLPDPVTPLTVFAPTNDAFKKLPTDVMQKIKTNSSFSESKYIQPYCMKIYVPFVLIA